MKILAPALFGTSALGSSVAQLRSAATSANLDEAGRRHYRRQSFFCPVRAFLSSLVDDSAFEDVSLDREIGVIFTSNGPLIYRHETNRPANGRSAPLPNRKDQESDLRL
jgi:hypothetical protein